MILIQEKRSRTCARGAPPSPSLPSCTEKLDQSKTRRRLLRFLSIDSMSCMCPSAPTRHRLQFGSLGYQESARLVYDDEAEWREYGYPLFRGDIGAALTGRSAQASCWERLRSLNGFCCCGLRIDGLHRPG